MVTHNHIQINASIISAEFNGYESAPKTGVENEGRGCRIVLVTFFL